MSDKWFSGRLQCRGVVRAGAYVAYHIPRDSVDMRQIMLETYYTMDRQTEEVENLISARLEEVLSARNK